MSRHPADEVSPASAHHSRSIDNANHSETTPRSPLWSLPALSRTVQGHSITTLYLPPPYPTPYGSRKRRL